MCRGSDGGWSSDEYAPVEARCVSLRQFMLPRPDRRYAEKKRKYRYHCEEEYIRHSTAARVKYGKGGGEKTFPVGRRREG